MSSNSNLTIAKNVKNDEFYTLMSDIEIELENYKDYFKKKVVYCNCDDPERSNFWRYFYERFDELGLDGLFSTHYIPSSPSYRLDVRRDIFTGRKQEPFRTALHGDGDFRSEECVQFLQEADVIVTNPPFSLFKEFVALLLRENKQFMAIGNMNIVSSRAIFGSLLNKELWLGHTRPKEFLMPNGQMKKFGNIVWYTNVDSPQRHQFLTFPKTYAPKKYLAYDNCDAINIDSVQEIPGDYFGVMGVPLTFLLKPCPDQFKLLGIGSSKLFFTPTKQYVRPLRHNMDGTTTRQHIAVNNTLTIALDNPSKNCYYCTAENTDKYLISPYNRLLIQRKV